MEWSSFSRIFSAYGEGQYEGNFWLSLRKAALEGSDFAMSSGSQIRDLIPVQDVALAFMNACTRNDIQEGNPLVVNIGSGEPKALLDFAKGEWSNHGSQGKILAGKVAQRPDDIQRLVPKQ